MSSDGGSDLLGPLFGDVEVSAHLSDRARLQAMLDTEFALAEIEAELGIIPPQAVSAIAKSVHADQFDLEAIAAEGAEAGNLAIPLVRHLTRAVEALDHAAARYVHWGATSQDIIDTGLVLQLQRAGPLILKRLDRAAAAAMTHVRRHIDTPIAGRTWLQQSTPITFGVKAAGWFDAAFRQRNALAEALEHARVLQFGGASGTLATLGEHAPVVADRLALRLGLRSPALSWHAYRDRLAHLACALGVVCGTLGKIGRDVSLLAQTEVGEAAEGRSGGSSAMPHKQNPVGASVAISASVRAPGLVATMLAAMPQEHERGLGGWQAEWPTLPELVRLTAGAARAIATLLDDLKLDVNRMRANLDLTRGLIASEAVALALAAHVGRSEAHGIVEQAARQARGGSSFADALSADPLVTRYLSRADIERHLSPEPYVAAARAVVERVIGQMPKSDTT
jgi:3-carboxy-cis,cis-muconate cycloisomerase